MRKGKVQNLKSWMKEKEGEIVLYGTPIILWIIGIIIILFGFRYFLRYFWLGYGIIGIGVGFAIGAWEMRKYLMKSLLMIKHIVGGKEMVVVVDMKYAKRHIKCDCGHYAKDHYLSEGCCSAKCPEADNRTCGCTWYYPNNHWILKQQQKVSVKRKG